MRFDGLPVGGSTIPLILFKSILRMHKGHLLHGIIPKSFCQDTGSSNIGQLTISLDYAYMRNGGVG